MCALKGCLQAPGHGPQSFPIPFRPDREDEAVVGQGTYTSGIPPPGWHPDMVPLGSGFAKPGAAGLTERLIRGYPLKGEANGDALPGPSKRWPSIACIITAFPICACLL